MTGIGIKARFIEIIKARYLPAPKGHVPIENVVTDIGAIATSQYAIWFVTTPWLEIKYYPRVSLAVAAVTVTLYGVIWNTITRSAAYGRISPRDRWLEASMRFIALVSIFFSFLGLSRGNTDLFLLCLLMSFASVLAWYIVVPKELRAARGLVFQDICIFVSGLVFCYFTWRLYVQTTDLNNSLRAAAAQLVQQEQVNFRNSVIVSQMGPIIYVACATTTMFIALLATLFSKPPSDDEGAGPGAQI